MTSTVTKESSKGEAASHNCVSQISVVDESGRTRRSAEDNVRKAGTCKIFILGKCGNWKHLAKQWHQCLKQCGHCNLSCFRQTVPVPQGLYDTDVFGHKTENGQVQEECESYKERVKIQDELAKRNVTVGQNCEGREEEEDCMASGHG